MNKTVNEVLKFNWGEADYKKGRDGALSLLGFFIFVAIFGIAGVGAVFGALLGLLVTRDKDNLTSKRNLILYAALIVLTYIAAAFNSSSIVVAILVFLSMTGVTIGVAKYGFSKNIGLYTIVWMILLLSAGQDIESAVKLTIIYTIGLAVSITVIYAYEEEGVRTKKRKRRSTMSKETLYLAALKGGVVGLSVLAGYALFPAEPMWAAITSIVILQATAHSTVVVGIQRALGTTLGALSAIVIFNYPLSSLALSLLFLVSTFFMISYQKVSYVIFTFLLTLMIVFSQALLSGAGSISATQRLGSTLLGVGVAFFSIYILSKLQNKLTKK